METKPCTRCNGNKRQDIGSPYERACIWCNGTGSFPAPDPDAIRALVRGRKPNTLRSSRPPFVQRRNDPTHVHARAYYVWRMARFHGGIDPTMPVMAMNDVIGDPYADDLDALVDALATECFGSNLRAAARWGRALGYLP